MHVLESAQARLSDGRAISGLRFTAWSEGTGIRVMVVALVPRQGESGYTIDPNRLTSVDVGTYVVDVGQTVPLNELTPLGIRDVSVQVVSR
jgi:hypothetical protein